MSSISIVESNDSIRLFVLTVTPIFSLWKFIGMIALPLHSGWWRSHDVCGAMKEVGDAAAYAVVKLNIDF